MVYRPTARVLTVLELLQTYGTMSGPELAESLEVDGRTVRRYVTTLQDMGIPVEAEAGRYGGYTLRPGFKLPPLMFDDQEVLMLVVGLMMARRSALSDSERAAQSALAKIERVLPFELRGRLSALQEAALMDTPEADTQVESGVVTSISLAVQQNRQILLQYAAPDEATERVVDPYGIVCHLSRWYMAGYCHLREGMRVFRLDRVVSVRILGSTFSPPPDFDLLEFTLGSFEAIPDRWNIDVLLRMPLDEARRRVPRELATLTPEAEWVRLRSSIHDLDWMARTLVALGCPLRIHAPDELRGAFRKLAEEMVTVAESA